MKKILIGTLVAIMLLGTEYINHVSPTTTSVSKYHEQKPIVKVVAEVTHLSQEEFERIGTHGIEHPSIEDFRQFNFKVELLKTDRITKKELFVPDIKEFKRILAGRYWFGNKAYQNNDGENFSIAERNFVMYYRGLTDDQFKDLLNSVEFHTVWVSDNTDLQTFKAYKLNDYLVFK